MKKLFLLGLFCVLFSSTQAHSYLGWVNSSVNFRKGPDTTYEIISTLKPGTQVFVSSLSTENGFVNILEISTNKEGFISMDYLKIGEKVSRSTSGILQNTGKSSSNQPEIQIFNNTDRELTLKMNDRLYTFISKQSKTFNLPSGSYEYRASAPGVILDLCTEVLKNNNG